MLITVEKKCNLPRRLSIDEQSQKIRCAYTMEFYSALEKDKNYRKSAGPRDYDIKLAPNSKRKILCAVLTWGSFLAPALPVCEYRA